MFISICREGNSKELAVIAYRCLNDYMAIHSYGDEHDNLSPQNCIFIDSPTHTGSTADRLYCFLASSWFDPAITEWKCRSMCVLAWQCFAETGRGRASRPIIPVLQILTKVNMIWLCNNLNRSKNLTGPAHTHPPNTQAITKHVKPLSNIFRE